MRDVLDHPSRRRRRRFSSVSTVEKDRNARAKTSTLPGRMLGNGHEEMRAMKDVIISLEGRRW